LLTEARQRYAGVPEFTYYLALAQREAKRSQEAVATFEQALKEAESVAQEVLNARFYLEYGAAAEEAGLYDKAAELFRKSIALDPANAAEGYNFLAYMWAEQNMHLDEAEEMVKRALQLDPNNGAYLDSLGWVEFRQGKFDQALNDLLRAAQNLKRDYAVVFEHIGDAAAKLNHVAQAVEYWQKAQTLDPQKTSLAEKLENSKTKLSKGESPNPKQ
jgi:tetratricopeptide (TPR) repeat protein